MPTFNIIKELNIIESWYLSGYTVSAAKDRQSGIIYGRIIANDE
jgi:hypothetical protein